MSATYTIHKTGYSNGEEKYHASVHYNQVMNEDDVIDLMLLNGSPFSRSDTQAILNKYYETINTAACNGWQVVTRNARYGVTIKGVFTGPHDKLDSRRHKVVPQVKPGLGFKKAVKKGVTMEKETTYKKQPELNEYINFYSSGSTAEMSPSHTARIVGNHLRFDPTDPEQGLFMIPVDATGVLQMQEAVKVEEFTDITPKMLTFRVSDTLTPGFYALEVRTKYGKSSLRSGRLDDVLQVV
ncbi:MAG: DUF4469 domain-containing protein [Anaerolineae bacterium]|nr:DUF4469 domain-containing protein [Anaerolineae bacterium]